MNKIINGIEITEEQEQQIRYDAKLAWAKQDFWTYCNCRIPTFYTYDRLFLVELCGIFQALYERRIRKKKNNDEWTILPREEFFDHTGSFEPIEHKYNNWIVCTKLMINMPPRHGKSLTAQLFSEWCFGKEQSNRIITISYNETLSGRFSKFVRNGIDGTRADNTLIVFNDVFPGINIKKGDAAAQLWGLKGQHMSYLGGSPTGTLTGMGCNIGIIDDLIKNKAEAMNERVLEGHFEFYGDTYLSRLEEGHMQILIMTRWSTKDLCGQLLKKEPRKFYVHEAKAYNEQTGQMLCPTILSYESLEDKKKFTSPSIIKANYQQQPIDDEGRLYKSFKYYDELPMDENGNSVFEMVVSVSDTADQGDDFLCNIMFGVYQRQAYVLDVMYTDQGMEITEPATASFVVRYNNKVFIVESNNGGRSFVRAVKKQVNEKHHRQDIRFEWFFESRNKKARILTNSYDVMNRIYWPRNWHDRWPEFFDALVGYQKEGKNTHDDAPDTVTRIIEYLNDDLPDKKESVSDNSAQELIDKLSSW